MRNALLDEAALERPDLVSAARAETERRFEELVEETHRWQAELEIWTTPTYDRWFSKLRDRAARAKIAQYFDAVAVLGRLKEDLKSVGDHVTEVRFNIDPGCRVYLTQEDNKVVLLLVGGDKSSQHRDIKKARELAMEWRREHEDQ